LTSRRPIEHASAKSYRSLLTASVLSIPVLAVLGLSWWAAAGPKAPALIDIEAEPRQRGPASASAASFAALEAEAAPAAIGRTVEVRRGDTLMALLVDAGADRRDAHRAITAMQKLYSPRKLKPGQSIHLSFSAGEGATDPTGGEDRPPPELVSLRLQASPEQDIQVVRARAQNGFVAMAVERPLTRDVTGRRGRIESSLFVAGQEADIPVPIMIDLIRAYSFDVDFQREIRPGDGFELVYETYYDRAGALAKTGDIIYAALVLRGTRLELYRFTPKSGRTDYFDASGQSARKTLMRTPIDGARITSGYGRRRHPILGYTKMHRGTDFGAPRGTPVYAAGDGVIELAGRKNGYGKYIRIRHNSTYKTAYAHLNGYAKKTRRGRRVKQGQVIGYVGSTGRVTGPHLHYEVMVNGRQANPLKIRLPSGQKLKGEDLDAFQAARTEIDRLRLEVLPVGQIARAACLETSPGTAGSEATPAADATC
jgi:murein DD-endopeptidase MepM/ murein hydrolase activator NlpD